MYEAVCAAGRHRNEPGVYVVVLPAIYIYGIRDEPVADVVLKNTAVKAGYHILVIVLEEKIKVVFHIIFSTHQLYDPPVCDGTSVSPENEETPDAEIFIIYVMFRRRYDQQRIAVCCVHCPGIFPLPGQQTIP